FERAELRMLEETRKRSDRDVREARAAVEEAEPQHVEAQETCERRCRHRERRAAQATCMQRVRLQRRVAVLLRDVALERFGRRMQQVAVETADRSFGDHVL